MTSTLAARPPYEVRLVQCPALNADQRAAAELRFRMALEFALDGPGNVLLTLQAYMLAQALNADADADAESEALKGADGAEELHSAAEEDDEEEMDGVQPLITLWEKAESDAIAAAFKPLGADLRQQVAEARFELIPR